jgi:hypothetical protein
MKHAKEIAVELAKGNVARASEIRKGLLRAGDDSFDDLEIMEIARQAMIMHLKKGHINEVHQIQKAFSISQDLLDETVEQAVVSSFYEGDINRIKKMKSELPIGKALSAKIVDYCSSWGKKDQCLELEELFA